MWHTIYNTSWLVPRPRATISILMNEKRGDQTVNIYGTNIAQNKYRKRPNKLRNRVMGHNTPTHTYEGTGPVPPAGALP